MTLYLKYRPKDFDSLVWQDYIKNTLKNASKNDKLVWAYLFCWPRWTGKTSTARILAKSINCLNNTDWNPCWECEICQDFANNNFIDIIEIDAASYTWVDNIRAIIEKAVFMPTKAKYKVYIIDEVHMLSKWSFNALLKILEEPPEYLKFILATTETYKVPETIISRCQKYDFKSISIDDIKNRLIYISKKENIKIDEESLDYIAKASNWWLRNAINMFEQFINSQNTISWSEIKKNLNLQEESVIEDFYNLLYKKDNLVLSKIEEISISNDLQIFFKELLFYIKDIIISKMSSKQDVSQDIFIFENIEESYQKIKNTFDIKTLFLIWIVKILSSYNKNNLDTNNIIQLPKIDNTNVIKEDILEKSNNEKTTDQNPKNKKIPELKEINELDINDLNDVFNFSDNQQDIIEKPVITTENNNTTNSFQKEDFISKLKLLKAKGSLTMSLRWSDIYIQDDELIIKTSTFIHIKQIWNQESLSLMNQVLTDLWYDLKIKVI